MRTFFVVITSWRDVLWKVVGWTDNPYVAISFFKEYRNMDKMSSMIIVECGSVVELFKVIREDYATDTAEFLDAHLITRTSKDERCYVIYKEKYSELFSDDYLVRSEGNLLRVCDALTKIMMALCPLIKYIDVKSSPGIAELILGVIFQVYSHTSNKRLFRNSDLMKQIVNDIDIVYFWRFLNMSSQQNRIAESGGVVYEPYDAVFIDSN